MKKTLVLIALPLLIGFASRAQSDKYVAAMQKNLSLFDSTKTIDQYQSLAATFDRIGDAEKTQWLPFYYAALAQTLAGPQPTPVSPRGPSGCRHGRCAQGILNRAPVAGWPKTAGARFPNVGN